MKISEQNRRPKTLREVAEWSQSLSEFGSNLRDWQHTIQRTDVHSKPELQRRLSESPPRLVGRFEQGDVADAYLAAYAEWLSDRASILRTTWCSDRNRVAHEPWFSAPTRSLLLVTSPGSFRQRNLFTQPEPVFTPKPGRPRISAARKREKARLRQRAYRRRVQSLLKQAREVGMTPA